MHAVRPWQRCYPVAIKRQARVEARKVRLRAATAPTDDPGLHVDFPFEKRALLFDLGDLSALPPRKLLRVSRPAAASPAVGYYAKHNQQQKEVLENPFGPIQDATPQAPN